MTYRLRLAATVAVLAVGLAACSTPTRWPWSGDPPPLAVPRGSALAQEPKVVERAPPVRRHHPIAPHPEARPSAESPATAPKLVGLSEGETVALLGPPGEQSEQPPGKVWTYRTGGCALTVHLFPDMQRGGFYALDYAAEDDTPRDACLRRAAAAHRKDAQSAGG